MSNESISMVLPMFNELDYINKTVTKAISVLESLVSDFEIIIVDDASNDGSEKIADILSKKDKRIKVIHREKNRKLGVVLKSGFLEASKDIVVYTDMDMPFDFSLLRKLVPMITSADVINGYRIEYKESFRRRLYSKIYNILIRAVFRLKIRDVNFSMKIFRRNILNSFNLKSEGSFISAEILIKAQYLGYKIIEVPVSYYPRIQGKSKLSSPKVILKIIYEMIRFIPEFMLLRIKRNCSVP
jgi:glycosyltransferase involved in cell wall biosynthesis